MSRIVELLDRPGGSPRRAMFAPLARTDPESSAAARVTFLASADDAPLPDPEHGRQRRQIPIILGEGPPHSDGALGELREVALNVSQRRQPYLSKACPRPAIDANLRSAATSAAKASVACSSYVIAWEFASAAAHAHARASG